MGTIREVGDGQLLERFATDHGEAAELAFAVLVERHGAMVYRVCRGVLSDRHDTEDAFQATFLVLVKKGRGLWVRDSLGPWLHQVAFRTASSARKSAARRRRCEERATVALGEEPAPSVDEISPIVHEEIERLPERFRAPVVLCDLEEHTHQQAARRLGWPIGTVKSRLARGRARLRERLAGRGLTSEASLTAITAARSSSLARDLPKLIDATARSAAALASARTIATGSAAAAAHGILRTVGFSRAMRSTAMILAFSTASAGLGWLAGGGPPKPAGHRLLAFARQPQGPPTEKAGSTTQSTVTVQPVKLRSVVTPFGTVEASSSWTAICLVEGESTIKWILPDKAIVKKGDLVAQLRSPKLDEQVKQQAATLKAANAMYLASTVARQLAELTLVENEKGIASSQKDLERMWANELAALAAWNLEKAKKAKVDRQIKKCELYAPGDGVINYANDTAFSGRASIALGATVRERQVIFKVSSLTSPRVVITELSAWCIGHVKRGTNARIRLKDGTDRILTGRISDIAPMPDPMRIFAPRKVYTTRIQLDDPKLAARPRHAGAGRDRRGESRKRSHRPRESDRFRRRQRSPGHQKIRRRNRMGAK